jgi:hypothetical protein
VYAIGVAADVDPDLTGNDSANLVLTDMRFELDT